MGKFTTILWDLDDTLLDFIYSERYALGVTFHEFGLRISEEIKDRYSEINESFWERLHKGEITRDVLLLERFKSLFAELGINDVDIEAFRLKYQEELGNVCKYKDDSLDLCKTLKGKYKQYIITNGLTEIQLRKLNISGFIDVVDGAFIAEEIGAMKPQKQFFTYCLSHVEEEDRRNILIVGDSLSSDIFGGVQEGIPTCWYHAKGVINDTSIRPDYEISNLYEIVDILG